MPFFDWIISELLGVEGKFSVCGDVSLGPHVCMRRMKPGKAVVYGAVWRQAG
jgi:hypothetical protein